ncbi:uncharacterized protein N7506_011354 [Penicillium brevicompactum]|uniref:uncharacterized protein n=1 Tax=Penicillium brevicompactum TaxID=5074 RepID=UPI00254267F4|nr:uncharacterized protein N7506_011354 [Penicillium brevicompactum]KAJ5322224.1 hypothetical protein N7506_011354 [Penicillium brevicompactum]
MGVDIRRPILPAPTESIIDTGESTTGTDLATDISRRTDKTSYSIPDDGSPITVSTRRQRDREDKVPRSHRDSRDSHTSLLIEYFEGGKSSGGIVSRPSVRVRVTPSSSRKSKDKRDHFQVTETSASGSRKPSYTHRISLPSSSKQKQLDSGTADDQSTSSISAEEEGHQSPRQPVDLEFISRGLDSEMSTLSHDTRYMPYSSDVSSMPPDSMINASSAGPRRKRSQSLERGSPREEKGLLKTPQRQRSRSLSTERIAHRVAEKLAEPPQESSHSKRRSKSRSGKDYLEAEPKSASRRRRHKYAEEDFASPESSLLSTSAVSSNRKSDQYSVRSGASKSSINNPKLLETVEDAIRRLILPELKELKKDQKVMTNKSKFDRDMATSHSSNTSSKDALGRSLSKHASAPDVMKPKVVLNKDSKDEGIVLSGSGHGESARSKERKSSKSSETSDMAMRWANRPELTEQDKVRRQRSKGLRDAHAAARVGSALTAASLKHHDSTSSLDKHERSSRKGSSHSRKSQESMKYNETELVFQKHNVAPMPMRSEIESQLTRTSLLSERTESPAPQKRISQLELARGPSRQTASPASRTPTRNSVDSRNGLGMRHANQSHQNISLHSASDRDLHHKSQSPGTDGGDWAIAAAAAANLLDAAHPGHQQREDDHHDDEMNRGLSPIQSVASGQTETYHDQYPAHGDIQADGKREMEPRLSIDSLSSAPSTNLARSTRLGTSLQSQSVFSKQGSQESPGLGYEHSRQGSRDDGFYGYDEESRLTGDNDDSEVDFMDKIQQGHQVTTGVAANPQFMHPMAVESAVASLMDPSVLESQIESQLSSSTRSQTDLAQRPGSRSPEKPPSEYRGSPLKQRQDADETSFPRRMGASSPPQSVTQSYEDLDDTNPMGASGHRGLDSPLPDEESQQSESEINTNPSIIQGPIGGVPQGDHWGYDSNPAPADQYYGNTSGGSKGLDAEYYQTANDIFGGDDYSMHSQEAAQPRPLFGTPPGAKDEGYVSAANPMSPSIGTPKQASRGMPGPDAAGMGGMDSPAGPDDPFAGGHQRHFSGYSHGVSSPLYDSATGRGIERIQSQDIVALMDHLTVRDAQRNARDTEILVTLVRSAAEMRTSFEQMKKFIADQDDLIMDTSDRAHERTHKALGGPRPLPASTSRNRQLNTADEEDKRKNIFKRALKGLSIKSGNDLTKIEGMLEQLLDEVEALRDGQDGYSPRGNGRPGSIDAGGYETPGPNGAPVEASRSPYGASPSRPVDAQRRDSDQRVSTVHEVDEEDLELDEGDDYLTSHLPVREQPRHERSGSLPLNTPPRKPVASGARSTETTPKADKARKHKSSSSSIFPKISRWSKSTATSMGDGIRNSIQPSRKERPSYDQSRSNSDLAQDAYKGDYYDPQGDDRLRSTYTLNEGQENRPPSPLVPSQVSELPKYRGNRGSLELQHPQPRQGPTGRYQSRLESEAQTYGGPISPAGSEPWESNHSLSATNPNTNTNPNRHSGVSGNTRLSPISDAGYSETSSRAERTPGPPRPPKVKDDGPLIPERPAKVAEDDEYYNGDRVVSRSSAIRSPPARKPTGPRPLTSGGGSYSPGNIKRSRYRGSPMQDYDEDY